ncbi:MAG: alpha/beta hydrolase [Candidatus Eisenbacteria bacterium]
MRRHRILLVTGIALWASCAHSPPPAVVTWKQIAAMPVPPADHRIAYGTDSLQFGELRLPAGAGPHPVAIVIHGGCWRSDYDLQHICNLSAALTRRGIATWTLEYRRIGNEGGGWPGTFKDVARGADHVRELAAEYPLDLSRVVTVGHSAGGHLALWLAARRNLAAGGALYTADPLRLRGVVSLSGITDLRVYGRDSTYCNASVPLLLGGSPEEVPDRYEQASPIEMLPLGVPVRLVHGTADKVVPIEQSHEFGRRASARGDDARYVAVEGAGHFDLIAPTSGAWTAVEREVVELLFGR